MGTTLATKQDLEILKREMENRFDTLELRMTIKFGTMLFLGLGLTVAVLRLWS